MNTTLASAPATLPQPITDSAYAPVALEPPAPLLGLRTILVPTDFSQPSAAALMRAEQLARRTGARLILLHVFDDTHHMQRSGMLGALADYQAQARRMAEQELEALATLSRGHGVAIETRFATGHAARQITTVAAETKADLVVLSTHGRTGWRRLVLGSVAEAVVRYAPCPVLTTHTHREDASAPPVPEVGTAGRLTEPPLQVRRVLVATDFSKRAAGALERGEELAKDSGAILTLLHVFTPPNFGLVAAGSTGLGLGGTLLESAIRQVRAEALEELRQLADSVRSHGLMVEHLLLEGDPAERICSLAESIHGDIIVLATQGLTGWDRPLLGSTAERVVRQAEAPVLIVRAHS